MFWFFSTAQIILKVFEKQDTKIKTAFELSADFYAFVLVDIKKLLLNKQGQVLCSSQITMVPLISLGLGSLLGK